MLVCFRYVSVSVVRAQHNEHMNRESYALSPDESRVHRLPTIIQMMPGEWFTTRNGVVYIL